ncbi:rhomboid family domain-containing protein [Ditylenchus destructor]|uniref:rhomboid protease n=1 Tax=Ditylenchus destructor TaxID=166010 RepID=A0AAD4NAF3_9BILA|nr:rhomboid family domain-containing protein [Ditylenchus destructor]
MNDPMNARVNDLRDSIYHLMNINFLGNMRPPSDLWIAVGFTAAGSLAAFVAASQYHYLMAKCRLRGFSRLSPAIGITVICCGVHTMWQSPDKLPTMVQYFTSSYASSQKNLCWPLLLSVFSHKDWKHMTCNLATLFSFTPIAVDRLGIGQFTALFITGGLVSSFVSLVHKCVTASPVPSLGASDICTNSPVPMSITSDILVDLRLGGSMRNMAKNGTINSNRMCLSSSRVNLIVEHLVVTKVGGTLSPRGSLAKFGEFPPGVDRHMQFSI